MIKKILIANRSEIASRLIFTCKSLDIKTVAIYTKQDTFLDYVYQADQAYPLSLSGASGYLNQDEIIKIALESKANAIHPGYGFLSENSVFAQKVISSGLIWIGPDPEIIKLMGDKTGAREFLSKKEIPFIPGNIFDIQDILKAKNFANKIGYPIILKNPLSGGGKGIKKVENPKDFEIYWEKVLLESKNYNLKQILLEKYIENSRHIEIQIAGDGQNFVHLFERECSIQRKHQKIIEEAPYIFLDNFLNKNLLEKIYNTALLIAQSTNYNNIGTVEFLVTPENNFYFLEINTRLQVEHSVTELITGVDLVALQIELAQNKILNLKQENIKKNNLHAIECRIYSEDPEKNYLPSTGIIKNLNIPNTPFSRIDHNLQENLDITGEFDPMICKITCWGQNRNIAIKNLLNTLENFNISGIKTNIKFLKNILNSQEFLSGNIHTQILSNNYFKNKILNQEENKLNLEQEVAQIAIKLFKQINKNSPKLKYNNFNNNWRSQLWK